jgi:hypothetical protein
VYFLNTPYFKDLFFALVECQHLYGVHNLKIRLSGRCVSADILVLNYNARNVAPTEEDQPQPSFRR